MRLIDADALGRGTAKRELFVFPEYADGWNSAIKMINNAPTVDAEPVRHGKWLQEHGIYHCSECGAVAPYDVQGDIIEYWPDLRFCYRCGAKMDKEDDR